VLVHYKTPKGVLCIGHQKIYGLATNMDPVDVSFKMYEAYAGSFVDATYRENYLNSLFPGKFSEIAFRYNELRHLPDTTLNRILDGMELDYDSAWPMKRRVELIKKTIRDASPA